MGFMDFFKNLFGGNQEAPQEAPQGDAPADSTPSDDSQAAPQEEQPMQ